MIKIPMWAVFSRVIFTSFFFLALPWIFLPAQNLVTIDMEQVFRKILEMEGAEQELVKKALDARENAERIERKLAYKEDRYRQTLISANREEKQRLLQEMLFLRDELSAHLTLKREDLRALEKEISTRVLRDIISEVRKLCRKEEVNLVIPFNDQFVLFQKGRIDITARILEEMTRSARRSTYE